MNPAHRYSDPASKRGSSSSSPSVYHLQGIPGDISSASLSWSREQQSNSLPTSYLDVRAVRHNLLQGGNLASKVSSLRSTGGGMNSEAGSGGSGDDGNGNDVGKCGVNVVDDGGGGIVMMEVQGADKHPSKAFSAKGGESEMMVIVVVW
ncbi:hypothetical protein Tco_0523992 [Tanacetum coccineum]